MTNKNETAAEVFAKSKLSADEIRKLANAPAIQFGGYYSPAEKHMIRTALLDYAAMAYRCEKLQFNMISHGRDIEIVDYILYGNAKNEKKNEKHMTKKTIKNCERLRCCESRRDKFISCHNCIIKDTCETKMKEDTDA